MGMEKPGSFLRMRQRNRGQYLNGPPGGALEAPATSSLQDLRKSAHGLQIMFFLGWSRLVALVATFLTEKLFFFFFFTGKDQMSSGNIPLQQTKYFSSKGKSCQGHRRAFLFHECPVNRADLRPASVNSRPTAAYWRAQGGAAAAVPLFTSRGSRELLDRNIQDALITALFYYSMYLLQLKLLPWWQEEATVTRTNDNLV